MHTKNFEHIIPFHLIPAHQISYPLLEVILVSPNGRRTRLSLLFDTGASVTTLKAELFELIGLQRWDEGQPVQPGTGGGQITVYEYTATIELLGKLITCPVWLNNQFPSNPYFVGVLGRDTVFNEFGFGYWESTRELYVTENP
jgi:hypothetical protein